MFDAAYFNAYLNFNAIIQIFISATSLFSYIFLGYIAIKAKKDKLFLPFILFIASLALYSFGFLGLFFDQFHPRFWMTILLTGLICYMPTWFHFAMQYTNANNKKIKISFTYLITIIFLALNFGGFLITNAGFTKDFLLFYDVKPAIVVFGALATGMIAYGLYSLTKFGLKNDFQWKKVRLIILGSIIFNIFALLCLIPAFGKYPFDFVANTINAILIAYAIYRYKVLDITPIALQQIVDLISDSYLVLNENMEVVDYNRTYTDTLGSVIDIKKGDNLIEFFNAHPDLNYEADTFESLIKTVILNKRTIGFERQMLMGGEHKYFALEVTPIFVKNNILGTIILFKDISIHKNNIETMKHAQEQVVEIERLASLGQLIGGIAHNLKTPIMCIAGGFEAIGDLAKEYDESLDDPGVTKEDHHEIAKEISEWVVKMRPYLAYMSEIITAVKDQAVQLNQSTDNSFTINELIKRIDILVNHELAKYNCKLITCVLVDENLEIKGDVNNLVQVLNNIITNSMHSYDDKGGEIELSVIEKGKDIEFIIKDYGKGIYKEVQERIFKEMVTTKGKHGTGLGLYISHSTIKGRFGGDITFNSEEGKGSTFYLTIPLDKNTA